jgi:hypothetical protein
VIKRIKKNRINMLGHVCSTGFCQNISTALFLDIGDELGIGKRSDMSSLKPFSDRYEKGLLLWYIDVYEIIFKSVNNKKFFKKY